MALRYHSYSFIHALYIRILETFRNRWNSRVETCLGVLEHCRNKKNRSLDVALNFTVSIFRRWIIGQEKKRFHRFSILILITYSDALFLDKFTEREQNKFSSFRLTFQSTNSSSFLKLGSRTKLRVLEEVFQGSKRWLKNCLQKRLQKKKKTVTLDSR